MGLLDLAERMGIVRSRETPAAVQRENPHVLPSDRPADVQRKQTSALPGDNWNPADMAAASGVNSAGRDKKGDPMPPDILELSKKQTSAGVQGAPELTTEESRKLSEWYLSHS